MNLNRLCKRVLEITDAELAEAEASAKSQTAFLNPLKMGTGAKVIAAGRHNLAVLAKFRELRDTIKAGAPEGHQ